MTNQEREAWALAYRLYEEFAPAMRGAATVENNADLTCALFESVLERIRPVYKDTNSEGRLLLLGAYGILERVYDEARKEYTPPPS